MTKFDWKQLLSEIDPIGADSPFYVSDLPFAKKMEEDYSSIKLEDKEFLRSIFKNKITIDLGSGNPKQSTFIRQLVCESEAKEYVGIDINYPRAELFGEYPGVRILQLMEGCKGNVFPVTLLREDMLTALRKLKSCSLDLDLIFVLVGIETIEDEDYKSLVEVLSSLCFSSGYALIGPGTHGIPLKEFGFKLERRVLDGKGGLFLGVYRKIS